MAIVFNAILFQAGWFASVLGAAHGLPAAAALAATAVVAFHLARAVSPLPEVALVATATVLGAVFETLLAATGWIRYQAGVLAEGTAPYWMVALWAMFATTLNVSLRWARGRPRLAALASAVAAPLSYYAGARLGALELPDPRLALPAIALGWAALTPLLLAAARRFDGYARP